MVGEKVPEGSRGSGLGVHEVFPTTKNVSVTTQIPSALWMVKLMSDDIKGGI